MSLLVVGTLAFDDVETPYGSVKKTLGGSATYFSYAASFFTEVRLVGPIGDDFPEEHIDLLKNRGIDCAGVVTLKGQKTFHWSGKYENDMNEAQTLDVHLNVLETFKPKLPENYRSTPFVFLANGAPELQSDVLSQMNDPKLAVLDTMNFWIENSLGALKEVFKKVDGVIINEGEARMLAKDRNIVSAASKIMEMGPRIVIVKKGEYGAYLCCPEGSFGIPAYPAALVKDPTGAGDSFAGGVMGYLASRGDWSFEALKKAMVYGTLVASFNIEDFSLERFKRLTREEIDARYQEFIRFIRVG
ncbi:MAG: sugar kinase [Planctomycetes bacterium]|nr:sugar kinase [Planctomycetota bacterium]